MPTASFVLYVDEAGDEGFSFDKGSSKWFILSGVITRKTSDLEVVKLVDDVRRRMGKPPKKPLHFRKLKHEQRLPFVAQIAKARLRTVCVLVHKPSLKEQETFRERYRLYFYAVRYLLERVSWCCRDHRRSDDLGDGSVSMIFSNRSGMSYEEMRGYLALLESRTDSLDVRIDWEVIRDDRITSVTSGKRMGLQIADAGSFFYAVEPSRHGFIEDRYARMLQPVVYRYHRTYLGYGLKFWPRETDKLIREDQQLAWVQTDYQ